MTIISTKIGLLAEVERICTEEAMGYGSVEELITRLETALKRSKTARGIKL